MVIKVHEDESFLRLKREIIHEIYQHRMIMTAPRDRPEGWTLISGRWSPFYIQLRHLSSFPETLRKIAVAMTQMIKEEMPDITRLVGVAFAGVPIATAISLESGIPACHTRKMVGVRTESDLISAIEKYGQHSLVEGVIEDDDSLCIIDDLVTGLESKLVARRQVLFEVEKRSLNGVTCDNIAVIIDRQQGAFQKAQDEGLGLHALIRLIDEGLPMLKDIIPPEEFSLIHNYLTNE